MRETFIYLQLATVFSTDGEKFKISQWFGDLLLQLSDGYGNIYVVKKTTFLYFVTNHEHNIHCIFLEHPVFKSQSKITFSPRQTEAGTRTSPLDYNASYNPSPRAPASNWQIGA